MAGRRGAGLAAAKSLTMQRRFEGAFVIALLTLVLAGLVNIQASSTRAAALAQARQISSIRVITEELFAVYVNEQTTVESFLDTGRRADLAALDADLATERRLLASLRTAIAAYTDASTEARAVAEAARSWHAATARDVAARQAAGAAAAERLGEPVRRNLFTALVDHVLTIQRDATKALGPARDRFDAASARVTRLLYIGLGLAAALLGALLLLVRRWVLAPLEVILKAVEAVRDGAMEATVPAAGPPELSRLGAHVDEMRRAVLSRGKAAMEAESQLRLLIDSVPDCAIVRLHPDGRPATWSAGAERITGYTANQRLDRSTVGLDLPDDPSAEILRTALAKATGGETVRSRRRRRHANGSEIVVDNALSAIRDDAGQVVGFAVVARDVTAAVAAEQALTAAHAQLAERAARLQETTRLQESTNADLLVANREMEAFTYTVSHDLRAPLRAIIGFSRILLENENENEDPDQKTPHYLKRVMINATRMSQLIDDLLALSRLRSLPLAKTATPLAEVVRSAWEELNPASLEPPAVLEIADLPTLPVDPSLLRQVFVNLLGNATKFSAGVAQPHLDVECSADPAGTGQPVITVRDNGIGFDADQAERLFDVFTRLHTEQEYEGTGIGLSIVNRIITRHGGRVWAEAHSGRGATFSFTLGPDTLPTSAPTPVSVGATLLS
jgi:PAS domain S-box-containing protein